MTKRAGISLVCLLAAQVAGQEKVATVPKLITFPDLVQAIQAHKGRVVVVDFWANY